MPEVNYIGPVMGVTLYDKKDGNALDLTAWSREFDYPYINSVSVEVEMSISNTIQVSISPPFEEWKRLTNDMPEFFVPGARVRVALGYSGGSGIKEYWANIATVTAEVQADYPTMNIEARGGPYFASKVQDIEVSWESTVREVLTEIAISRGWELGYLSSDNQIITNVSVVDGYEEMDQPVGNILHGSIYSIMRQLIEVVAGYEFWAEGDTVVIVNPAFVGRATKIPIFEYKGNPVDVQKGIYPLLEYNSTNSQVAYESSVHKVSSKDIDADTKGEPKETQVTSSDEGLNQSSMRSHGVPDEVTQSDAKLQSVWGEIKRGKNVAVSSRDPHMKKRLQMLKRRGNQTGGLQAEIQTIGHPLLRPGQFIEVRNLPRLWSGKYQIRKVTHVGDDSGYSTNLNVLTINLSDDESEGMAPTKQEIISSEAEPANYSSDTTVKTPSQ